MGLFSAAGDHLKVGLQVGIGVQGGAARLAARRTRRRHRCPPAPQPLAPQQPSVSVMDIAEAGQEPTQSYRNIELPAEVG